eukprot:bmy_16799T0
MERWLRVQSPPFHIDREQAAINFTEHLVTFCLGEEDGVHTVEDASRKLALMDSQGRVWAQDMLLREELESYPLSAIVRCDTVIPPGHSSSLMLLVCQEPERTQPDVHFFQGLRLGAELIREDIQGALHNYRSGRGERRAAALRATRKELQCHPSPAAETPPPQHRPTVRAAINTVEPAAGRGRPQADPIPETEEMRRPGRAEVCSSADPASRDLGPRGPDLASLQAEREVDILNHVFDDVETFVSRLQKSAEATRVLEHRERSRRTRHREAGGEEAPPSGNPEHPLPGHSQISTLSLGSPLAPPASLTPYRDLTGSLPLSSTLPDAVCMSPITAPASLPTEGLLTLRAKPPSEAEFIDVLQKIKYAFSLLARLRGNIANPSSPELLHFLFGPLQMIVDTSGGPQFASCVRRPHLTSEAVALLWDNVTQLENTLWTSLGDSWTRPGMELPSEEGPPYRPEFYSGWEPPATDPQGRAWEDPVEKQLQHERRRQQVRLRLKLPQVTQRGRDWEFWGAGLAPAHLLLSSPAAKRSSGRCQWEPETEPQGLEPAGKWVLCNYDFQARNSSELPVKQWDILEVLDDQRKWWKVRDQRGQEGYESSTPFPPPPPAPALAPAPGPRPARTQAPAPSRRAAPGPRTPEPQLSPRSNASEVRAWLQGKGFSSGTVAALGALSGAQLFSMQKEKFRALSPEEGARVYSQITVQRSLLEDKEKVSELEAVMKKQKKRMEEEVETEVI